MLEVDTGVGCRLVHVEPGHRLDPSAAYADPRDPNDRPLAQHLMREIGPSIASAKGSSVWLGGIDELVDRGQAGAFVASRLAYRRLLKRSGWLIVPALVGLALFWSFFELTGRRMNGSALDRVFRLLGRRASRSSWPWSASCSSSRSRSCTTRSVESRGGAPQSRGNDDRPR